MKKYLYTDTETTGLDCFHDEILELAITDDDDNALINEKFHPMHLKSWDEAAQVNHIYPEDVARLKPLAFRGPAIYDVFKGQNVVTYNCKFDYGFLRYYLVKSNCYCCMNAFTHVAGKRTSLINAVKFIDPKYGEEYEKNAHGALEDTKACAFVWHWLLKNHPEVLEYEDVTYRSAT